MKKKKEWWQLLDWSQMRYTYEKMLMPEAQVKMFEEGYWSLGKGVFASEETFHSKDL